MSGDAIDALGVLREPARRALYEHVISRGGEVSRDEAADAVGIKRGLAAFHLDRLVKSGLLQAGYRRPAGRSGPGAGRPAKLYSRATGELGVSLPPRRYQLAAEVLLRALRKLPPEAALPATRRAARAFGRELARDVDGAAEVALTQLGFEPQALPGGGLQLRNCPFDALARRHREAVCAMNLALIEGIVGGGAAGRLRAELSPEPGRCCVVLRPVRRRGQHTLSGAAVPT